MNDIINLTTVDIRNKLTQQFKKLATLAQQEFEIKISPEKMLNDDQYFNLVIEELTQLNDEKIAQVIVKITHLKKAPKNTPVTPATPFYQTKFFAVATTALVFIALFMAYVFNQKNQVSPQPQAVTIEQKVVNNDVNAQTQTKKNTEENNTNLPLTLPVANPKISFKLHGSNTIGEKLAPALVEGYLKQNGIEKIKWVKGDSKLERTVQYIQDGEAYAVELHAHGSSTAFKDLKSGSAQLGMASRRIKDKELTELTPLLGDLSKVGNEHIVGLDGLAVIVNQNNPIKTITTENLAKIFSGEINNWGQLGGADQVINIYARDKNSGTWDTFKNLVLKKFNRNLAPTATRLESSSVLTTKVSQDEFAIGFIGLNFIQHNKALAISSGENTKAIFPTRFTIGTEDYALSRRLYFYSPTNASNIVKDFARYAISVDGQNIVEKTGLISQNIKEEEVYSIAGAPASYNQYTEKAKRLSLNFRFDYSNRDLDNKGKRDLLRLINFMENHAGRRVVLLGFSDSIGEASKNQVLSLKRAQSVEQELVARGIPVLAVEGLGESLPIANNNTEAGRERNRRVEVWVL